MVLLLLLLLLVYVLWGEHYWGHLGHYGRRGPHTRLWLLLLRLSDLALSLPLVPLQLVLGLESGLAHLADEGPPVRVRQHVLPKVAGAPELLPADVAGQPLLRMRGAVALQAQSVGELLWAGVAQPLPVRVGDGDVLPQVVDADEGRSAPLAYVLRRAVHALVLVEVLQDVGLVSAPRLLAVVPLGALLGAVHAVLVAVDVLVGREEPGAKVALVTNATVF